MSIQIEKIEIINRLKKLAEYLNEHPKICLDKFLRFEYYETGRDSAQIEINLKDFSIEISSWLESHHNGDFYNHQCRKLSEKEELQELIRLEERIKVKAVEKARRELERSQYEELTKSALKKVESILK